MFTLYLRLSHLKLLGVKSKKEEILEDDLMKSLDFCDQVKFKTLAHATRLEKKTTVSRYEVLKQIKLDYFELLVQQMFGIRNSSVSLKSFVNIGIDMLIVLSS